MNASNIAGLVGLKLGRRRISQLSPVCLAIVILIAFSQSMFGAAREARLYVFTGQHGDGQNPESGLARDKFGWLYGTTQYGGQFGRGTVYQLMPPPFPGGEWTRKTLHSFAPGEGTNPGYGTLKFDSFGALYGTTEFGGVPDCGTGFGCGTVFQLSPPAAAAGRWTLHTLYAFTDGDDGGYPLGGVIFDKAGALYGTTASGGNFDPPCAPYGCGVVYKVSPPAAGGAAWSLTALHSFQGDDGGTPLCTIAMDGQGALYGTTYFGGAFGAGVVFKVAPDSNGTWTDSTLHEFTSGVDGGAPIAGVTLHHGSLYGTTVDGGQFGWGNVYQLIPNGDGTWSETVLYSFTGGDDGGNPESDLTFDQAGALYSTAGVGDTRSCPFGGCGTVFKLIPPLRECTSWTHLTLYNFRGGPDGFLPLGKLTINKTGTLYGTTHNGGGGCTNGCGTVFQITQY